MAPAAAKKQQRPLDLKPLALPALDGKLVTWDQVDNTILEIAKLNLRVEEQENEMNGRIHEIESQYSRLIKSLKEESAFKIATVLDFAKAHRADFGDKKSRKFNFGTIAFSKAGKAVKFLLDEVQIIANLKKLGLATGVVKSKEWIDKDGLRETVPEDKREKVGFDLVDTGDEPSLKIDKKSIEILKAAQSKKTA